MNNKTYQDIAKKCVSLISLLFNIAMFVVLNLYLIHNLNSESNGTLNLYCSVLIFITFCLILFNIISIWYKENAIAHIQQAISICSPHLSNLEVKELNSQFAKIKTRNDYFKLDNKLREIAANYQLDLPKFNIL